MPSDYNLLLELAKLMFAPLGADMPGASSVKGHPKLHVVVGEANPALTARMRIALPPAKYLLHVHPPGSGVEALLASRPKGERTLFLEITQDDSMLSRLSTFLKTLRPDHASMTVQNSKDPLLSSAIPRVQLALNLEMPNLKVDRMSGLTRLRASLLNLGLICSGPLLSARAQGDAIALVCGAGPSLAKQLELIAQNASRFVIIACGHAAIKMKEAGVEPDFIVEADPRCRINWSRYKGSIGSKPLVALTCADPAVTARFEKRIWFEGDSPEAGAAFDLLGLKIPRIAISRGVIVTALDFAFKVGCRQAVLLGCDLALSDDGSSHAGSRRADGDELSIVEVDGSEPGAKVKTTLDFNDIRKALEAHLKQSGRAELVLNCTQGGAKIAGIPQLPFEQLLASIPQDLVKKVEYSEKPLPLTFFEGVRKISSLLSEYGDALAKLSDCSKKLIRELKNANFDQAKFQKEKNAFDIAIKNEGSFASTPGFGRIVMLAKNKAEDISDEEPGSNLSPKDAPGQLRIYAKRAMIAADFCSELRADLDFISGSLSGIYPAEQRDPMDFKAYRNISLEALRKLCPPFAKAAEQGLLPSVEEEGFSLHLRFEDIPQVSLRRPDGSSDQFSGLLSAGDEARLLIGAFAKDFDPKTQAVIIVAPGNYMIVEEFAKAFPDVPCIIVEPWPGLLGELIRRCCFLHRLPEGASIVIANDAFSKKWRKDLSKAMHLLKSRNMAPKCLFNPKTASLPEVKALLEGGDLS